MDKIMTLEIHSHTLQPVSIIRADVRHIMYVIY